MIRATSSIAPYFVDCINEQDLDEVNVEIIRNNLFKAYLEDFASFCQKLGGTTAEVMQELLAVRCQFTTMHTYLVQFEADRRAIIITINSFDTELSKDDRAKLYPRCGNLYPVGLAGLARADDYEQVRQVCDYYAVSSAMSASDEACSVQEYKPLFDGSGTQPGDKTLEDKFFEHEVST